MLKQGYGNIVNIFSMDSFMGNHDLGICREQRRRRAADKSCDGRKPVLAENLIPGKIQRLRF